MKAKRPVKRLFQRMNEFICIFKLKDQGMKRKEQVLHERADGNESWEEEPADQLADGLEDEINREFWIKVSNFYDLFKYIYFLRI